MNKNNTSETPQEEHDLYNKFLALVKEGYDDDDFELGDIAKYGKNYYGIKFYTSDGGYLTDYFGTLEELAEDVINILNQTNSNYIQCPHCGHSQLYKKLSDICPTCEADIITEVSIGSHHTPQERIRFFEMGAIPGNQQDIHRKDFKTWYVPKGGLEKGEKMDQDYFKRKVEKIMNREGTCEIIPDITPLYDLNKQYFDYDTLQSHVEKIIGLLGVDLTEKFISEAPELQYMNFIRYENVIELLDGQDDFLYDDFKYESKNPYDDYSYFIDSTVGQVVSTHDDNGFLVMDTSYGRINDDDLIYDIESDIRDFIIDYYKSLPLKEFIRIYYDFAWDNLEKVRIENEKLLKRRAYLTNIAHHVKETYFKDVEKGDYTMSKRELLQNLLTNIKLKINIFSDDEIQSLEYVNWGVYFSRRVRSIFDSELKKIIAKNLNTK